uniref:Putative secreted protein n=1 Tax=Ixodes ricinus TaxID=34613 RepID=A0A6B0ULZ9_IXORI
MCFEVLWILSINFSLELCAALSHIYGSHPGSKTVSSTHMPSLEQATTIRCATSGHVCNRDPLGLMPSKACSLYQRQFLLKMAFMFVSQLWSAFHTTRNFDLAVVFFKICRGVLFFY